MALMKLPRAIRLLLKIVAAGFIASIIGVGSVWIYFHPHCQRISGIVYGHRQDRDLTLEVVRPASPNGMGIILMVSGHWESRRESFQPWLVASLLRNGYTIFAVYHISQPEATVMEITEEVNRAVRFVRHNAGQYGVDPLRLGVTGGSSGGHLSLMLATCGKPGPADAPDPVDRESSAVQAVAVFFPVTDLLNLGASTENLHDGGPPKSFVKAFGPNSTNLAIWQIIGHEMSPIYHVSSNLPPTLIHHGDADTLVPLDQSERFQAAARKSGGTVVVVVHSGGRHGWLSILWDIRQFGQWFDQCLRK